MKAALGAIVLVAILMIVAINVLAGAVALGDWMRERRQHRRGLRSRRYRWTYGPWAVPPPRAEASGRMRPWFGGAAGLLVALTIALAGGFATMWAGRLIGPEAGGLVFLLSAVLGSAVAMYLSGRGAV
jgi:hypothetical protein